MIDISELLFELCEDERVYDPGFDLLESGVLDSYGFIEFFSRLEDFGILIHPTRIDRSLLRTPGTIQELVRQHLDPTK